MEEHLQRRQKHADEDVDGVRSASLSRCTHPSRAVRVQHLCQCPQDASHASGKEHLDHDEELDFNIAETSTAEPVLNIVIRPDDCVQEVEEVGDGDGGHQDSSADVAVAEVLNERWDDEDGDEEVGSCEGYGG